MQLANHRIYNIEELCTLQDDGNYWLVDNMIPRVGRTMVYGHGATNKSAIIFDLCVAVASGGMLLRQFPVKVHGPVLLVSTESSKYRNRDRILSHIRAREGLSPELIARGGKVPIPNVKDMPLYFCQQPFYLDDPMDLQEIRRAIDNIVEETGKKLALLVLDPLDSFLQGDENSAKETKSFRRAGNAIVDDYETAVIVIHHATKGEQPSLRGNSAWRGWTDAALFFQKRQGVVAGETKDYVDVAADKQRDGPDGHIFTVIPERDAERGWTTFTVVLEGLDEDALIRNSVQSKVYATIKQHGAITQKDLMQETGCAWKRLVDALNALAYEGLVAQDAFVTRPTSPDGARTRKCPAWRAVPKTFMVDAVSALLKSTEEEERKDEETYDVQIIGGAETNPAPSGASGNNGSSGTNVGPTGFGPVSSGPGVP